LRHYCYAEKKRVLSDFPKMKRQKKALIKGLVGGFFEDFRNLGTFFQWAREAVNFSHASF
jgi:hypothetical protein